MRMPSWIETLWRARRNARRPMENRDRVVVYPQFQVRRLEERRVLNAAPVLTGANAVTTINQNDTSNSGTPVTTLIAGKVSDADAGDPQGIAVTGVNNTNGNWQFSTDNGTNWTSFNTPTTGAARLLAADSNTLVRFVPDNNFHGTVSAGITFQAWDQTTGTAGGTADVTTSGGTTAFSSASASSDIVVNAPPTISGLPTSTSVNDDATTTPFSGVTIADADGAGVGLTVTLTLSNTANGSFTTLSGFSNMGGGVYTFSGTQAAATTAIQGLVFTPTNHQVVPGSTVTTTVSIDVADSVTTTSDSTSIVATAVNTTPTIQGTVANQPVNDNSTLSPFSGVTISDPDNAAEQMTVTVTLSNAANGSFGTLAGFTNDGGGVYSFTGTRAQSTTALQGLVFTPTNHQVVPGQTVTTTFTISVDDGDTASDNTTTVIATAVNTAPSILGTVNNQAVNDNATINPFSGVTISDPDNSAEQMTITVTLSAAANGSFSTLAGFTDNGGGIYTFTGTRAQSTTALQGLVFTPTNHQVVPGQTVTTTFTIEADDGLTASNSNTTVVATAVNTAPSILGTVHGQTVNDDATISPFSGVSISDPDNAAQQMTITVTLSSAANGSFSTLAGFTNNGGGVYTFTGTKAQATTALQGLVFTPTAHQTVPGLSVTTTFTIKADDGLTTTNNNTTVVATAQNNPLTISGTASGQAVNDNATIHPFSGVTIQGVSNPLQQITVTVTQDVTANGSFTTLAGFTDAGGGVYTFTGTRLLATAALRGLVFTPTNHQVVPGQTVTTGFTILADNGIPTTDATTTVVATATNTAPSILGTVHNQAVNDNSTISPFSGVTISDPDNSAEQMTITVTLSSATNGSFTTLAGFTDNGGGVYTFTGTKAQSTTALQGLVFTPTIHQVVPGQTVTTTFTIQANDGLTTTNNNTTVIATAVNDPPSISGAVSGQTVNDDSTLQPFTTVVINDVDNAAQQMTVTVTLSNAANGSFTTLAGFTGGAGGVYTFTGTRSQATAALQGLVFTPTNNQVVPGQTVTTTFTIQVNDGATVSDANTTVIATAVNDPPSISGTVAAQPVNDNATIHPFSSVTINDNDNAAEQMTVTVTQDVTANGSFTTLAGFTNNGGGVYTFTGTRAQATTALRGLVFTPTNHQVVPGQTVTTGFTIQVNDGLTATDTTTTVIATAINNPPTITGTIAGQQVNDNATIAPFTTTVINDPDNAAEQMTVTVTQSNVLNGSFTTLAGFTSLVPGVYTFTGTRAQATAALNGLVFTPTAHQVSVGSTVTTTFTVVVNDGLVATNSNTSVVAKAINDAPVLDPTVVATLTGITEDNANNPGNTVASIVAGSITDVDFNPLQGIALTGASITAGFGTGTIQYSTNGGATWIAVGTLSDSSAILLRSTDLLRFVPDQKNGATVTFTYRAWDQTSGTAGQSVSTVVNGGSSAFSVASSSATLNVADVNDAPTLVNQTFSFPVSANGTPVTLLTASDVDLPAQSMQYSIVGGNTNNAFAINSATGQITINDQTQLNALAPTTLLIMVTDSGRPALSATARVTIDVWSLSVSSLPLQQDSTTTLTVSIAQAAGQLFQVGISFSDGTTETLTSGPGILNIQHLFQQNPNEFNPAAPIPIIVTVIDSSGHQVVVTSIVTVPGTGLFPFRLEESPYGAQLQIPITVRIDALNTLQAAPQAVLQSVAQRGILAEAVSVGGRSVTLRVVKPTGEDGDPVLLSDDMLSDLPRLFKKLPDGRYRIYLSDDGRQRVVIDVFIRQGKAVDPGDEAEGTQDRPPTTQIESTEPPDPIAQDKPAADPRDLPWEQWAQQASHASGWALVMPVIANMQASYPGASRIDHASVAEPFPLEPHPGVILATPLAAQDEKEIVGDSSTWQTAAGLLIGGAAVSCALQSRWEKEVDDVMERLSKYSLRKSVRRAKD
jgi:plastocyanin